MIDTIQHPISSLHTKFRIDLKVTSYFRIVKIRLWSCILCVPGLLETRSSSREDCSLFELRKKSKRIVLGG